MVPKFRAWNGYRKIMADYVSAIQNGETQGTPSSVNVIVNEKNETWNIENDHVELLQFTGLKDANGKEIYEDDIIKVSDETGSSFISVVKYFDYDDYPAFDLDPQYLPTDWYFEANILSTLKNDGNEIKVVGNAYSDPELLEAQHDTRTD